LPDVVKVPVLVRWEGAAEQAPRIAATIIAE
jgi:hypothetical protein